MINNTDTNSENISFLLEEKDNNDSNDYNKNNIFNLDLELDLFENNMNEENYETYTVKELLKICGYYGIDKTVKAAKCKKIDIIETIMFFEAQTENTYHVYQRKKMWLYMSELAADSNMKKYILWE